MKELSNEELEEFLVYIKKTCECVRDNLCEEDYIKAAFNLGLLDAVAHRFGHDYLIEQDSENGCEDQEDSEDE